VNLVPMLVIRTRPTLYDVYRRKLLISLEILSLLGKKTTVFQGARGFLWHAEDTSREGLQRHATGSALCANCCALAQSSWSIGYPSRRFIRFAPFITTPCAVTPPDSGTPPPAQQAAHWPTHAAPRTAPANAAEPGRPNPRQADSGGSLRAPFGRPTPATLRRNLGQGSQCTRPHHQGRQQPTGTTRSTRLQHLALPCIHHHDRA
jgi:hypothetical protein